MESKLIKSWVYKIEESSYKIELFEDYIVEHNLYLSPNEYTKKYTIGNYLSADNFRFNTERENELMASVIKHFKSIDQLNEKEKKFWRFWKHLDYSKIPLTKFFTQTKVRYNPYFLELSPLSVKEGYYIGEKTYYHPPKRISQLFFFGPTLPTISLSDRKSLQNIFLNALAKEAEFTINDAFLLFDYNKIPHKKWERYDSHYDYDFIEMKGDRFFIGGRDGREGGMDECSIEHVWYNPSPKSFFTEANKEIRSILEQAIIT